MFSGKVFTNGFIISTASENRFSLTIFLARPTSTGGSELPTCINNFFYCPLALAVLENANMLRTVYIELSLY
jgi:hypothetical protein